MKIEQNWKTQVIKDNPTYPFIVVDNWYTQNEEKAVWKELDLFSTVPKKHIPRAENTIVATNPDGSPKSNAFRFYIDSYYTDMGRTYSPIFNCMYKQKSDVFHNLINQCMPYGRSFLATNNDSTLLSYYENNDHYDIHCDTFAWTILIWMVREPKRFTGGDFDFPEIDTEIKLKNNRMIAFPSCYNHRVSPLKFKDTNAEIGYGKYTITHFYFTTPKGEAV